MCSYDDSEKMDLDDVFDDPDDILEEGRSGTAQKKKKLLQVYCYTHVYRIWSMDFVTYTVIVYIA